MEEPFFANILKRVVLMEPFFFSVLFFLGEGLGSTLLHIEKRLAASLSNLLVLKFGEERHIVLGVIVRGRLLNRIEN